MDPTPFGRILGDLLARVPGAFAAALVDSEGETVDYAGLGDPFDVKVAAAHLRIVIRELEGFGKLGAPRWLVVRGGRRSIVTRSLPDGYALVLLLRRRAGFTSSERAFAVCERALAEEAGWPLARGPLWYPISVRIDRRGRPSRVGPDGVAVEVLGAVMGLPARERGFRVRTSHGNELTLVREPGRAWYADAPLAPDA